MIIDILLIMTISKAKIKADTKYKQSTKGKIVQARYDKKRDKAQIDGLTKATKALFNAKKESLGLTVEQFLVKLLELI